VRKRKVKSAIPKEENIERSKIPEVEGNVSIISQKKKNCVCLREDDA